MRTTLFDNGDFAYFADISPVADPVGGHSIRISSRLASARDGQAEQIRFQACLQDDRLLALADLIRQSLELRPSETASPSQGQPSAVITMPAPPTLPHRLE